VENRELENPDTVLIRVGTNYLRRIKNLDFIVGGVCDLVLTAKTKYPKSKRILSGVLRRRDASWRLIDTLSDRFDWVAKTLGAIFYILTAETPITMACNYTKV
jgi:hypothetical protein